MKDNLTSHYFHAEAHALSGKLQLPFEQQIKKQAFAKIAGREQQVLNGDRGQSYLSQHAKNFRLEGIISYAAAHTQVSGHKSIKHPGASVTLATSVVEDLNVLNVVTADRVVAQISTTHFPDVYTPEVTFLGTHFDNLRIARHPSEPLLKIDLCDTKLAGDATRVGQDQKFQAAVTTQYQRLKTTLDGLSDDNRKKMRLGAADHSLTNKYHRGKLNFDDLAKEAAAARDEDKKTGNSGWGGVACSLVEHVDIKDISLKGPDGKSADIRPPCLPFGHVIHVPEFGTIFLAELTVNHNSYHLTMIRLELGCIAQGSGSIGTCNVNGGGKGGGGPT